MLKKKLNHYKIKKLLIVINEKFIFFIDVDQHFSISLIFNISNLEINGLQLALERWK